MMNNERASVFGDDQDIDLGDFKPKTSKPPAARREDVRAVSHRAQSATQHQGKGRGCRSIYQITDQQG
jgi:hypothetical protein